MPRANGACARTASRSGSRIRRLGEQVECSGACHRLGAALHLELTVDGIDIRFDGAQCQNEPGGNITIGEASRNEAEYFQFALGQRVEQRLGSSWCRG